MPAETSRPTPRNPTTDSGMFLDWQLPPESFQGAKNNGRKADQTPKPHRQNTRTENKPTLPTRSEIFIG
ncbi:MAG TPA: hypothetical protein VNA13_02320 [Xanthomonadales bacterium]|nr:hypothetical protein [Xanthomonadales bacterium]